MGYYINQTSKGPMGSSFTEKCEALIEDGAHKINTPIVFTPNLVCVVDNGRFAAAGHAFDVQELAAFKIPSDDRRKQWFDYKDAEKYAK